MNFLSLFGMRENSRATKVTHILLFNVFKFTLGYGRAFRVLMFN